MLNGQTCTNSGTFNQVLVNSAGCDSNLVLVLRVNAVVASASVTGANLSSIGSAGAYQWVSCPDYLPIAGAHAATYTASSNGEYALIVSQHGCSDTSACVTVNSLGVISTTTEVMSVYPNPLQTGFLFKRTMF